MKKKINKFISKITSVIKQFSLTEKLVFSIFLFIFIISSILILNVANKNFLVNIPEKGGTLTEGIIGTPRFINPVIANSDVDKDLSELIYSGLVKINSNGEIIPDLAERYEVSEDGLIYNFYLKSDAVFHDGEIVTTDDIAFTILKIQNPQIRSPKITDWEGIAIEKVSDKQIKFILQNPNSNFIKKTDVGILPKHLWQEVSNDAFSLSLYNIEPVGSGPYKLDKIKRDDINIPISYTLKINKDYTLNNPLIKKVTFKFTKNENELISLFNNNQIDAVSGLSPESIEKIERSNTKIMTSSLPRIFSIFINQTESPALSVNSAREALRLATPKNSIVADVFKGYAEVVNSPINYSEVPSINELATASTTENEFSQNLEQAEQILIDAGWEKNEEGIYTIETDDEKFILSTSISTSNVPELTKIAEIIAQEWRKIGANVSVKVFENSDLNQNVIRPRNFETLLFGTVIKSPKDLYSFWHSSRRNDPGLNITSYANIETDAILEKLKENPNQISKEEISNLISEIKKDIPAIFLYSPKFTYIISDKIKGVEINNINSAENRFRSISKWFINTDKIWKIFKN